LYDYNLTRRGEYLVRGIEKSIYREFNHFFKVIDHSTFMLIASWLSKLAKRYGAIYFSVMTLQITNEAELIARQGEINSERLMGQFFTGLCQAFRESDLSSRLEGTMYFLLPMANQDGCLVIIDRIKQTVQQLVEESIGKDLTVGVSYMTSAEITQGEMQGDLVLAELQARMLESNICLIGLK
jgi:GGDEF domain-containing protein